VWQSEQGLPQNSVNAILQTQDGYLWIGTQEGLARFDGVRFTVFNKRNTPEIHSNYIWSLFQDKAGELWIATYGGGAVRYKNGVFRAFTTEQGLTNNVVRAIFEDREGSIWFGTDAGLSKFKDGKFRAYTTRDGLSNNIIRSICQTSDGSLWFATYGGGLNRLKDNRFEVYTTRNGLSHNILYSLLVDTEQNLWIGSENGLSRMKLEDPISFHTDEEFRGTTISSLYQDKEGSLWVGSIDRGLSRYFHGQVSHHAIADGLSDNFVRCIFADREGSLWIGTFGGGLNRLKEGKFINYTKKEGLSENEIWSIYQDHQGAVWIGTSGGGANRLNGQEVTVYNTKNGLSNNSVFSFSEDNEGNFWIGTWGGGLNRLTGNKIQIYNTDNGLVSNSISSLFKRKDGGLWIGTDAGLSLYSNGTFTNYTEKNGLTNSSIFCLFEDQQGTLWIGTESGGLNRFKDGKFVSYSTRNGLSNDFVTAIYGEPDGTLWIGTWGGGLNRYRNGKFTTFSTKQGLYDDNVFQILEDANGNFWMSCNKGVFRVNKKQLEAYADGKIRSLSCLSYGKLDGMVSEECNGTVQPAGWKTRDGKLWFPTMKGVAVLDPNSNQINALAPPIVIEQAIVDGNPLLQPEIAPGKEHVEFHYTALSFLYPEKIRFKYKLEGLDAEWIDAGTRRVAYYTHLPPGHYQFRVIACNNDGVWNLAGATLAFDLNPYFYQTSLFYVVCLIAGGLAVYLGIHFRLRKIKAREHELESLVRDRTKQLEEANDALKLMADRDGLTEVANYRKLDAFLDHEWRMASRDRHVLSVIMIDLDYFKNYNDTYGHQAGDDCLKQVAFVLSNFARRVSDLVARYGGEEFMVVLGNNTPLHAAVALAEKMREAVEDLKIEHANSEVSDCVTISLGVASGIGDPKGDKSALIEAADQALYEAKREGRNRVKEAHHESLYQR
jgi:diguanylate cyclase (GGDEF)-like protein